MNTANGTYPWKQLLWLFIGYAIAIFLLGALSQVTWRMVFFYFAYGILIPTLLVVGAWAGLGPGSLLKRTVISTSAGVLLIVAGMSGMEVVRPGTLGPYDYSLFSALGFVVSLSIPICIAAHVPYWLFRALLGWQLIHVSNEWDDRKTTIRDMFVFTAIIAVSIAAPRYAADMVYRAQIDSLQVGQMEFVESEETDVDGTPIFVEVEVTEENIYEFKEKRQRDGKSIGAGMALAILVYFLVFSLIASVFTPVIWFSLRKGSSEFSLWACAMILFLLVITIGSAVPFIAFSGRVNWVQHLPYLFGYAIAFSIASVLPLLISHRAGIRLVTRKSSG